MDSSSFEEPNLTHDEELQDQVPASSSEYTDELDRSFEVKDEISETYQKPAFKNALSAKRKLQALALQKQLLISPSARSKSSSFSEKSPIEQPDSQEPSFTIKPKKEHPIDKAKATIEEIELLKKSVFGFIPVTNEKLFRRSRSKSAERDFIFRKRDRKVRNYRRSDHTRRSLSPLITTAKDKQSEKSKHKYPKNWEEFKKDKWTFEKLVTKESHLKSKNTNVPNDIFRQLLFDSPADSIKPYHFKNLKGDEVKVPFKFMRYTMTKPKVAYNENIFKIKDPFLNRKQVLDRTRKENRTFLEKFYSRNTKRFKTSEPMGQRNWYLKNWRDSDSKIQETSIGLSFLQTYSDDDEEEEQIQQDTFQLNKKKETIVKVKELREETKTETSARKKYLESSPFILEKTEYIPLKEEVESYPEEEESKSPDRQRTNMKTESSDENIKIKENISWTPEKKVLPLDDLWLGSPKLKRERMTPEDKNSKVKPEETLDEKRGTNKIPSDDEWAETPERKIPDSDEEKKKKKKKAKRRDSDSPADIKKSRKKKKKLDKKKKKQREKDKKIKKKEKLKAEKLKKEKKKQKEKEKEKKKEILKKLKKELRQNLEEERRKKTPSIENLLEVPVKVKIEKEDYCEKAAVPTEDLRNFLNQKDKDHRENIEMVEEMEVPENNEAEELFSIKVKKEKMAENKKRQKSSPREEKAEEKIKNHKKIENEKPISNHEEKVSDKIKPKKKSKKVEEREEVTPDTEEYQSNWESDDGISPIVKPGSKKSSGGWESDEEVFERRFLQKVQEDVPLRESPVLEMPLDIKKFSRRSFSRQEKKRSRTRSPEYLDMEKEIKLLEAERINLNNERMQLEMEKIRIHELERKNSQEEMEHLERENSHDVWHENQSHRERWLPKDESIDSTSRERREKGHRSRSRDRVNETASTSINTSKSTSSSILSVHSSPEITSTKSPKHTGLENAYQEFMRAVSGGTEVCENIVISSTESEMPVPSETTNRAKVRYSRSRRDRRRDRSVEVIEEEKVLSTTDPKILQEILLPGEIPLPEIPVPVPVPVPSPKLDLSQGVLNTSGNTIVPAPPIQPLAVEPKIAQELTDNQQYSCEDSFPKKPFTFSTLVIPSKKPLLLERSNWKLDDDSEEELLSTKKTLEELKYEQELALEEPFKDNCEDRSIETSKMDEKNEDKEKIKQNIEEKSKERSDRERFEETDRRRESEKSIKRKHSRSRSPMNISRDKRRREDDRRREEESRKREEDSRKREEDSRKREEDIRKREDIRRRDSGNRRIEDVRRREDEEAKRRDRNKRHSPPRQREPSPRRRRFSSPIHRRSPPRHRSPPRRVDSDRKPERGDRRSPQRSSPAKRRRSYSPIKPSLAPRRRSPSPRDASRFDRISKSPRRSPMEGLKRSVADSTISDDLLPQPYPTDSSGSPLCSSTPAPSSRRSRLNLSPKRPSLDERISQVLGIEIQSQPPPAWKPTEPQADPRQNVSYPGYHNQNVASDQGPAPPTPATSSKVLQVGNIIQVVPNEDYCAVPPPRPVQAPSLQKIVQVGNMLQIVPSDMEPIIPSPVLPPEPPMEPPVAVETSIVVKAAPERRSAEDVLAGRMAERDRKKQEKEDRKREKERKRKEKDKKKKMRLKVSTEEMIKRALELDGYIDTDVKEENSTIPEVINDTPGLDPSRSILSSSTSRFLDSSIKTDKERKSVQFADGVRPGEGTSPSGGEELSSPPPQSDVLMKPKKHKKSGSGKKKKRKIKVKVVKKRPLPLPPPIDSDEEYENLPPPSPPPGSPPPHVFPVRAKVHTINNIPQHYLPSYGITTAPQTPPIVQPQPRLSVAYQPPPTAMYRTPPPNVIGQHYQRISHAPPMGMNVPPPPPNRHRDQPYGSF